MPRDFVTLAPVAKLLSSFPAMYRLIEVGHLFTTVYWWICAIVGITHKNIAARGSNLRSAIMNSLREANREVSWALKVGIPSFYGGYASSSRGHQVRQFIDSDQYSTEVCWSGVEDKKLIHQLGKQK